MPHFPLRNAQYYTKVFYILIGTIETVVSVRERELPNRKRIKISFFSVKLDSHDNMSNHSLYCTANAQQTSQKI